MAFEFTPDQRRAIEDRDGPVLVSAAAGSGKTRVLTERLIRRVTDPEAPVDINRFLIITFTRAAAAELRDRIMRSLSEAVGAHPEDRRLRRQQNLCCQAQIGTIHAFCSALIRENCHALGLPPRFSIAEEERTEPLRQAALDRLLEARYAAPETFWGFSDLADTVGAGADDSRLAQTVLQLHTKLLSQPFPAQWAEAQKRAFAPEEGADAGDSPWGRALLEEAAERVGLWAAELERALGEMRGDAPMEKAYGSRFAPVAEALRELARSLPLGWDRARETLAALSFPRLGVLKNYEDEARKERMKALWDGAKKAVNALKEDMDDPSAVLLAELRSMAPAMGALLDLSLDLDREFSAEKLRRGWLDYADLEHYAVRLLYDPETGNPSALARETAQRFEEVMVDEYQDVSPVQERIFRAVSREEQNLFLVGDVKQSIYRFRLADPRLFLKRYHDYLPAEEAKPGEPRRVLLRENFRSRRCVLEGANQVFSALMSPSLGELDYDEAAALRFASRDYGENPDPPVELCLVEADAEDSAGPPEGSEAEARYVGGRILELMRRGAPVWSGGSARSCNWGDFVLLMRSPGGKGHVFHRILSEMGIPVSSKQGDGFFTSLEITVAVNLLSLVDNPHADVPLISALRSPVFGFTPDELSLIRAERRDRDFYSAVQAAAVEGDAHCAAFLEQLGRWRALAPDLEPERLLRRIFDDTDLYALCAAMPDGEGRRRNLDRLSDYAAGFSGQGHRGVFRFVRYLRSLADKGTEPDLPEEENAVHILSIHKSKGLEFPFVFVVDLGHRFNLTDRNDRVLMHSELGLGPKVFDRAAGLEYPSLARRAITRRMTRETLSEELRVLYVAMTRAREGLFLTGAVKNAAETLEKRRLAAPTPPLSPELLRAAQSPLQWLLSAALLPGSPLRLSVVEAGSSPETAEAPASPEEAEADAAVEALLAERLSFVYPWQGSVERPAKLTATELKALRPEADPEAEALLAEAPRARRFPPVDLGRDRSLSAAERGTATHCFLQYLDFSKADSPQALAEELRRVTAAGHLTEAEARAVDLSGVRKLFASPLGQRLRSGEGLRREFRFTLLAEAEDYFPDAAPEDRLLLQGVVDCCFEEEGGLTVLDYKTDRVTPEEVPARAEYYRPQLEAYAAALRRILGKPVRRCVLWFLRPAMEAELRME